MIVDEIKLTNSNGRAFSQAVDLSGLIYILEFRYNTRAGYWILNMYDSGKLEVMNGIVLSVNWPLLIHCSEEIKPPGTLMLIDTSGKGEPCTDEDLGTRCRLVYITNDE